MTNSFYASSIRTATMEYALALQVSDQPWSGSGDEGSNSFRRPSRLTLELQGIGVDGNPLQETVELEDGKQLLLKRGGSYNFRFTSPSFASIESVSLAADQGAIDSLAFDRLAIQPVSGLSGDLELAVDHQLDAAKPEGSLNFTSIAPIIPGVRISLYDGTRFESLRSTRVERSVDLDDAYARLHNRGDSDTFSSRILGEIQASNDGLNQWALLADDGVRLWIGDQLLVDQWRDQPGSWRQVSLDGLIKGEWYPLRIEYYENRGTAALRLAQANAKKDPIPPSQLRLAPESPTQVIKGLYGSLSVDRQGGYSYQPDAFNQHVRALSPDQTLDDRFELQLSTPSGATKTRQLVITLTGAEHTPAFALDFHRDGFSRVNSDQSSTVYYASGKPLAVKTAESIELRLLNVLDGDQDLRDTQYGKIWFHVLNADGTRLPDSSASINPELPTFFLVHGFLAGVGDKWISPLKTGFSQTDGVWKLREDDVLPWQSQYEPNHGLALALQEAFRADNGSVAANIVMVDWGNFSGSGPDYLKTASEHVPAVGRSIANYIHDHQINPETTTLIGHSLGGHISGFAGQSIQEMTKEGLFPEGTKLSRIIGMDAAGPLFNSRGPSLRLSPDDAKDVFNLHTSTTFGFDAPLAAYDVYINSDYNLNTPFSYSKLAELARLGQLPFFGAIALDFLFNPSDVLYRYHQFDSSLGQALVNLVSGIDSHSYAVAFLAALIHEDVRLSDSSVGRVPVAFTSGTDNNEPAKFYEGYWGNTFRTELAHLQQANDARLKAGEKPFTFTTLIKGAGSGGIFQDVDLPAWAPGLLPGSALDWEADASSGFGFLHPAQIDSQGFIPFSDYMLFWRNGVGIDKQDLSDYSWFYSPDFESNYLNGWTAYGPSPTIEYGLLKFAQAISDLAATTAPAVQAVEQLVESVSVAVDQAASVAMQAIRSGWRLIFGGPVIDGQVFFDQRTFDQSRTLLFNSDLRINSGELQTRTDSVGRYVLNGLDDPSQFGNRDAILDYRDGLIVAGDVNPDGSISLIDSISGANMGFPLVGLPGGNASLLSTLKYAALLRWRPEWDTALIPVTPEFITNYYSTLFPNTPAAFFDDSYTPYTAISSSDANDVAEGIDVIEFTYSNLAIVKAVMELLREFGLDYDNTAAWGSALELDPTGSDRIEITAFSAYGFALGQRFGQDITLDGVSVNPFDRVGRPAFAPQFDLDNRTGERISHLRALAKEILAVYPTKRLLSGAPDSVLEAYKDLRTIEESRLVDAYIEDRLGPFLNHFSFGLDVILQAVHTRIATAESLGREFVIPGIAGPKRLVLESLAGDLVRQADASTSLADFLPGYMKAFYTPETIDRPGRDHSFDLAVSLDQESQLSSKTWTPTDGSQLDIYVSITGRDGSPQPAPDHGLSLRLRVGGTLQEGLHFYLPEELSDRTLYIPAGETKASFAIQVASDQLPANASLSFELLSADSGYGVDPLHAVANTYFSANQPTLMSGGGRHQFQPFALVDQSTARSLLRPDENVAVGVTDEPMIYWANQETPNVVLRGRFGLPDAFLLGRPSAGLPHIENFHPSDGDVILIDSADFADSGRSPEITDFNTYAGLVFDLVQQVPLALISDYSADTGDLAWAGLSSSAGYYRFASPQELAQSRTSLRDTSDQSRPNQLSPELDSSLPVAEGAIKVRRGDDLQGVVATIGRSQSVALVSPGQLDVSPGELGYGTLRRDILISQSRSDQDKPTLLSGGSGSDTYVVASSGWTVVSDVGGGKRDALTGLPGRASQWRWREVGRDGDVLLQRRHHDGVARVLLFDPFGDDDKNSRIERVKLAGRRSSLSNFLEAAEQIRSFGYGRLDDLSDGSLGDIFNLRNRQSRLSLADDLGANAASLHQLMVSA